MPDSMGDGGDPLRPASPRLRSPLLRLATWNVNSIRTRLDRVLDWLARAEVDVLAMQETKCADDQFPTLPFFEIGYEVAHCGFNQWNGVAIASRVGLDDVEVGFDGQPSWSSKPGVIASTAEPGAADRPAKPGVIASTAEPGAADRPAKPGVIASTAEPGAADRPAKPGVIASTAEAGRSGSPRQADVAAAAEARALAATCAGLRVWSLYVPNGRALGDPHYTYKLDWLAALRDAAEGWLRRDPAAPIALVGDWNIAPTDDDVWSVEFFQGSTHVSEPERKAFNAIVDAQFTDVVRPFTPGPGVYTYWDYTQLRFPKRQGMRIDFILASPALTARVADAQIVREERKGKAPSDHAPVLVDLRRD